MQDFRARRYLICFVLLCAALAGLMGLNLFLGSTALSPAEVWQGLRTGGTDAGPIVWSLRLPRLLAAALLGGALSVSGFLLQTFFGNPIAGPFVLGISSGAKLTVALTMIWTLERGIRLHSGGMILAAFLGAMAVMGVILLVSRRLRSMALLVVCGVMIGYIASAVTEIVVTFADDSNIVNLHNWSLGSFSGIGWSAVGTAAAVTAPALVWALLLAKPMGAYQLGEGYARTAGVPIRRFRTELILLSSVLSACVTALAGPISFVGIAVPHLMKRLFATARPLVMIPACFLGGGVFCLLCDLIARTLFAPTELSISTVTAVFGVPVVLWMLLQRQRQREMEG